jgi:hypothetical protein
MAIPGAEDAPVSAAIQPIRPLVDQAVLLDRDLALKIAPDQGRNSLCR